MANQIIGKIPEFTTEDSQPVQKGQEEVKEAVTEEVAKNEKETQSEPPAEVTPPASGGDDGGMDKKELEKALVGLKNEREKLLREVVELKGKRREIKQDELIKVQDKIEELNDVNPDDVNLISRVLRSKGYMTKAEAGKMFYDSVKNDTLTKFLEKYPEYKSENDPNDIHWGALQRELSYFRMPDDPHKIIDVLEKAHKTSSSFSPPLPTERNVTAKKRQIEVASVGTGGTQKSSSARTLDPTKRAMLEHGGFSKEDIETIEKNL